MGEVGGDNITQAATMPLLIYNSFLKEVWRARRERGWGIMLKYWSFCGKS